MENGVLCQHTTATVHGRCFSSMPRELLAIQYMLVSWNTLELHRKVVSLVNMKLTLLTIRRAYVPSSDWESFPFPWDCSGYPHHHSLSILPIYTTEACDSKRIERNQIWHVNGCVIPLHSIITLHSGVLAMDFSRTAHLAILLHDSACLH